MIDQGERALIFGLPVPANDQGAIVVNRVPAKDLPAHIVDAMMVWLDVGGRPVEELLAHEPFCCPSGYIVDTASATVVAAGERASPEPALIQAISYLRARGELSTPLAVTYSRAVGPDTIDKALICPLPAANPPLFSVVPFK